MSTPPKWMREVGSTGILMEHLPSYPRLLWYRGRTGGTVQQVASRAMNDLVWLLYCSAISVLSMHKQGRLGIIPVWLIIYHGYRLLAFRNSSRLPLDSKGGITQ